MKLGSEGESLQYLLANGGEARLLVKAKTVAEVLLWQSWSSKSGGGTLWYNLRHHSLDGGSFQ
ncbi:MAG: hypothetical protein WCK17_01290 [Verrucomicrobiota bacterium]